MMTILMTAPLIVFLIVVAPLWLVLHYRSKRTTQSGLSQQELQHLEALTVRASAMQARIETLEKILDVEAPQWRRGYE